MKALVYHGLDRKSWDEVPDPTVTEPTDVVVRIDTTTICGSDLRILTGGGSTVVEGRVLGHEAVATVVATGSAVSALTEGDRVLVPAITSCGRCADCRRAMPGQCRALGGSGWVIGNLIDGLQAEYARVPYADTSVHKVPEDVADVDALFLADVVPTGYELGVRNGRVEPGNAVAVVGTGPVALAAIMTAGLHGAGQVIEIGVSDSRLAFAERFGADYTVNSAKGDMAERLDQLTEGQGVDVAIEAVGLPETFETCARIVRPGGTIANIGAHRAPATLHLEELWNKNVTITTGLVDTVTVPILLRLVRAGRLRAEQLGTHEFALDRIMDAYDLLADAARHKALKVVLKR